VVPPAELENAVNAIVKKLISKGAVAVAYTKKSINATMEMSLRAAVENEGHLFSDIFKTEDAEEGAKAFLEKRKPNFKGK
jgi:enoyl-CoA hydratase/carnithine racemase